MQPRPLDAQGDFRAVVDLLGRTRINGGVFHPGGIQWWLRELGRDGFEAFVLDGGEGRLEGFVMIDDTFVVSEHDAPGEKRLELLRWAEQHMRRRGGSSMSTHVPESSDLQRELEAAGFERKGGGFELMADTSDSQPPTPLPPGFWFGSLLDVDDDAYIEMHRAAWSDTRPSPYRRELHDRVRQMPQFRAELVTIAIAPDGTPAAYCIGWLDEQSQTLEIEPLGTHRHFRRLGLARAVVREVIRRAGANGARRVLVWNDPSTNEPAYGLYTSAGMTPNRTLAELTKRL